ncbi:MAG: c-type cytochrome [Magnetococcales bacterium]|nr:c-type cytochrome [Magnetococcales bacterium]
MSKSFLLGSLGWVLAVCCLIGGGWTQSLQAKGWDREPVQPLPVCTRLFQDKVRLGRQLFHEVRLSFNNSQSCADCHPLHRWGADGQRHSRKADGSQTVMNTPTVYNVRYYIAQFWNGRVRTLQDQVEEAVRLEMGSQWPEVVSKLAQDASYRQSFAQIYSDGLQAANVRDALAEFMRSLLLVNSRFDRYLRGESNAITPLEQEGYRLFKEVGCVACHQGVNLGGNLLQKSGIFLRRAVEEPVNTSVQERVEADRFQLTGNEEDREVFKVPALRLVTRTAPYFHDGSLPTVEEAVGRMAQLQLGRSLNQADIAKIVAFFHTLEGSLAGECR